jgi:hypothetical protein
MATRIHWKYWGELTHKEIWRRYIWTTENFVHGSESAPFEIMKYLNIKVKDSINYTDK